MKLVSVDGVDGAGKTFLIDAFLQSRKMESQNFKVCHLRPKVIPKRNNVTQGEVKSPENKASTEAEWLSLVFDILRISALAFDYVIGTRLVLFLSFLRGQNLIIFDRYVDTLILEPWRYGLNKNYYLICSLICRLSPRPAIRICIVAEPDQILSNKQELSQHEILDLQAKRLAYYHNKNDFTIKNTFDTNSIDIFCLKILNQS